MKRNRFWRPCHRILLLALLTGAGLGICPVLHAQQEQKTGGSPLDTIMRTRLWADVPEAKEFVRESRPAGDALDYQPMTGSDPKRPPPKTKAELEALQSELEGAAARNEAKAGRRKHATSGPEPGPRKARLERGLSN